MPSENAPGMERGCASQHCRQQPSGSEHLRGELDSNIHGNHLLKMQDMCESRLDATLLTDLQGTCFQGCHCFWKLWGEVSEKEDRSSPQGRPGAMMEELGTRTHAGGQGGVRNMPSLPAN